DEVDTVRLDVEDPVQRLGRQENPASRRPAQADGGQQSGHGAGVAVAVGSADVGGSPSRGVGGRGVEGGAGKGAAEHAPGIERGVRSKGRGGGGTTGAMRSTSASGAPMVKSAPSGLANSSATNSLRVLPVTRRSTSPNRWP